MENDVHQLDLSCQYINSQTDYRPSCWQNTPVDDPPASSSITCDCDSNNCISFYSRDDKDHQPTGIRCVTLDYFTAYYFIIVTVATVGYGDVSPTTL